LVDEIRVNISMPDVLSLPLGGGTVIHVDKDTGTIRVGPDSVGYQLETQALAFGGQITTTTDIALAAGLASKVSSFFC
jgi:N-methylhydantoinase A/oxoprolinase/acetone carboxylase beta subunit